MNFLNVDIPVKNVPELDKGFVPLGLFFKNYQKGAAKPLCIAVERSGGQIGTYETKIYGTPEMEQADAYYVDRLVKFLLWSWGGFKVSICGDDNVAAAIRAAYSEGGSRAFDKGFMEQVYGRVHRRACLRQKARGSATRQSIGRHGQRAHQLRRRARTQVSAVLDGDHLQREVVWFPKTISTPVPHDHGGAVHSRGRYGKGGHVDAIGVSSAGVYIDNKCMVASLLKVGRVRPSEHLMRPSSFPANLVITSPWWWPTTATSARWRAPWAWAKTASWASPWAPARLWAMWIPRATSAAG
ncbi:MAG: hypothetical protein ACLRRT_09480 [Ruthenibacterium lactatiformans]